MNDDDKVTLVRAQNASGRKVTVSAMLAAIKAGTLQATSVDGVYSVRWGDVKNGLQAKASPATKADSTAAPPSLTPPKSGT